jgi:hypothetical protein
MRRSMAFKKRVGQLRNQLRTAMHLTFPELNPMIKDLTRPTAREASHVPTASTNDRCASTQWQG